MRYRWYVGLGFDRDGNALPEGSQERHIDAALGKIIEIFGGVTMTRGFGAWKDDEGKVVREAQVTFEAIRDSDRIVWHEAEYIAGFLKGLFLQSAVLLTKEEVSHKFI
jgi:hypothetical protein